GGFFLQQRTELNFAGYQVQGLEVIGYDPATGKFPSTVYSTMGGVPIPYQYDIQGDQVRIRTELNGGATYIGSFSPDGNSGSGGWRPDEGAGPGNGAYDINTNRATQPLAGRLGARAPAPSPTTSPPPEPASPCSHGG